MWIVYINTSHEMSGLILCEKKNKKKQKNNKNNKNNNKK